MESTYTGLEPHIRSDGDKEPHLPADAFNRQAWSGTDMDDARLQLEAALGGQQFRAQAGLNPFSFRFAMAGDHKAITPKDIAAAAQLHPRSLQQQMHDHLGSSPSAYVRGVRLDRARLDLLAAKPGEALVSEIAKRWNFGNLGRFSNAYFARFGEYPRDTLAR